MHTKNDDSERKEDSVIFNTNEFLSRRVRGIEGFRKDVSVFRVSEVSIRWASCACQVNVVFFVVEEDFEFCVQRMGLCKVMWKNK